MPMSGVHNRFNRTHKQRRFACCLRAGYAERYLLAEQEAL
jgi:hypothetical protein